MTALGQDSDITDAKAKLEVLRKGCCHPQVWDKDLARKKRQGYGHGQQSHVARPFGEIMVLKVEQSRMVCEERQRELVFNLNSLAGVAMLQAHMLSASSRDHRGEAQLTATSVEANGNDAANSGQIISASSSSTPSSLRRSSDSNISKCFHIEVTSLEYLRRALKAFTVAYGLLERNRGTCPLVGLVRVGGIPTLAFRVCRVAEEEGHRGDTGEESEENLTDRELCADGLCFIWSRQRGKDEGSMGILSIEGVEEISSQSSAMAGLGDSSRISSHTPLPLPASTIFFDPLGTCGHPGPGSGQLVSAKMSFGVGRRLQQLRIQNGLRSVVSMLKMKVLRSWREGTGSGEESTFMVFPKEVALLAATGVADAFTRVTLFDLFLPTLSTSEDTVEDSCYIPSDSTEKFQIKDSAMLSADLIKDFPLSFRSRSWRLDVRTLHGWCLEVKVVRGGDRRNARGFIMADGEGEGAQDTAPEYVEVSGKWMRLHDVLSSVSKSMSSSTSDVHMGMEVQVLEATFDIDLFQVCAFTGLRFMILFPSFYD